MLTMTQLAQINAKALIAASRHLTFEGGDVIAQIVVDQCVVAMTKTAGVAALPWFDPSKHLRDSGFETAEILSMLDRVRKELGQ